MHSTRQDGGWGWAVVAGAFVAQLLSDGISYGFGILYVDLMETYHGTSAEISSIGSLSYGAFSFIGPVAGILTSRFGYRFVAILGAFLECLGVFLSAFTPNLEFLYFSVGILIGVGGGMIYIASYVCVSTFFLSKRPLATSISSCGSSAGIFLFGFLYRVCIDHYGWRGALLIFSGLMANGIVCGVLFRPFSNELTSLDNYFAGLDKNSVDFYKNSADLEKRTADLVKADNNNVLIESDMYSVDPDRHTTDADKHSIHSAKLVTASDKLSPTPAIKSFDVHLNEMLSDTTKIDGRKIQHLTDVPAESRTRCDASVDTNKKISLRSYFHDNNHSHQRQNNFDKHSANGNLNSRSDNLDNLENRAGVVCYSSEVTNSPTENQPLVACHREIIGAMTKDPVDSANECPGDTLETKLYLVNKSGRELVTMEQNSTQDLSNKSIQHSRRGSMLTAILGTSNFHIFKDWKFVLYGLSTFLYCSGDGIPFILFPDMAEKNGFSPSESASIISEFGISAFAGNIIFGALSQALTNKCNNANIKLSSYSVILAGVAIICAPWTYSYPVLLIIGAAYGLSSAGVSTLATLVLIELVGEERLADAFGWSTFFGGVGYTAGPVVAGWLYDVTGSYVATFIATGSCFILSGVVLFPVFYFRLCIDYSVMTAEMPTNSRGLFPWLVHSGARLEDFADRLNHVWTFGFLLILAVVISWKHGYQSPISCWCPHEFSDAMVEQAHKSCWHSYYLTNPVSESTDLPFIYQEYGIPVVTPEIEEPEKELPITTYYQWVPVILCLQALVFKLPHVLMQIFHGYSGLEFGMIAGLTTGYQHLDLSERQKLTNQVSRWIYRWCKLCSCGLPWRSLTFVLFIVKCLYCVNVVLQMRYIDNFLKPKPDYDAFLSHYKPLKSSDILTDMFANEEERKFTKSEVFHEYMLCKLKIRELRKTLSYTFYCHFHVNRFTEHAYLILWVWLLFVTLVTVASFAVWILKTLLPFPRQRYVQRLVDISAITPRVSDTDVARIANMVGEDGVMALKLIGANSSELFVRDVVSGIVKLVKDGALASSGQFGTVIQQNPLSVSPGISGITESGL